MASTRQLPLCRLDGSRSLASVAAMIFMLSGLAAAGTEVAGLTSGTEVGRLASADAELFMARPGRKLTEAAELASAPSSFPFSLPHFTLPSFHFPSFNLPSLPPLPALPPLPSFPFPKLTLPPLPSIELPHPSFNLPQGAPPLPSLKRPTFSPGPPLSLPSLPKIPPFPFLPSLPPLASRRQIAFPKAP